MDLNKVYVSSTSLVKTNMALVLESSEEESKVPYSSTGTSMNISLGLVHSRASQTTHVR